MFRVAVVAPRGKPAAILGEPGYAISAGREEGVTTVTPQRAGRYLEKGVGRDLAGFGPTRLFKDANRC